jgi:hypothetical protein
MNKTWGWIFAFLILFSLNRSVAATTGKHFDRAIFVVFENTDYSDAIAQPFFKQLAEHGALLSKLSALTHPSQGNYIGLTSGALQGVTDDEDFDLNVRNIADLLEAKGLTWKVYAEGYPGHCFSGSSMNGYFRKHNPFISYTNIRTNPSRCANIVDASQFDKDVASGSLPNYVFYIPDIRNDGHDTGVQYADKWYARRFSALVNDRRFMEKTVLISTFDESGSESPNHIYTSIVGPAVEPGIYPDHLNIYSLLSLVEDNWNLATLGINDAQAKPVPDIWK